MRNQKEKKIIVKQERYCHICMNTKCRLLFKYITEQNNRLYEHFCWKQAKQLAVKIHNSVNEDLQMNKQKMKCVLAIYICKVTSHENLRCRMIKLQRTCKWALEQLNRKNITHAYVAVIQEIVKIAADIKEVHVIYYFRTTRKRPRHIQRKKDRERETERQTDRYVGG